MALVTPIISPQILPFDATLPYTVGFLAASGDQVVGNTLTVYNNSTNAVVFTDTISSLILNHTINANVLINGTTYKCTITTQNSLAQSSSPSSPVVFICLSSPTISITNIDSLGKVYNQNVTFSATYTQQQNELLQEYMFQSYDSNKNLLQSYPVQYTSVNPLTQLVSNLNNGVIYFIRVITLSVNGQSGDSGYVQFTPQYITPLLNATLTAINIPSTGSVKISANIVQLLGTMTIGSAVYTNTTWIDLTASQVTFQSGFNINQDNFALKLWCTNIPDDVIFLTLISNSGHIDFKKSQDRIHVFRYLKNCSVVSHFISNNYGFYSGWNDTQGLDSLTNYDVNTLFDNQIDSFIFLNTLIGSGIQNSFMLYVDSIGGLMDVSVQSV